MPFSNGLEIAAFFSSSQIIGRELLWTFSSILIIKALVIIPDTGFSPIMSRDEDEIDYCQYKANWPPNGSEQKGAWMRGDGVSGQRILRRQSRIEHNGEERCCARPKNASQNTV